MMNRGKVESPECEREKQTTSFMHAEAVISLFTFRKIAGISVAGGVSVLES